MNEQNKPNAPETEQPDNSIASRGGKASAAKLTPDERQERAKKAAEARWSKDLPVAEYGDFTRPLRIGSTEIPCFVLGDGMRVLTLNGMLTGLGMKRGSGEGGEGGNRLARFATGKSISPFISEGVREKIISPLKFRLPGAIMGGGGIAYGYEATILSDLCESVLSAREAGKLMPHQAHIAKQCEILVRGFARVGIIALVDEATGYQYSRLRDDLQRILETYVSKELARWARVFESDFYMHIYRLRGWKYNPNSSKRTHALAGITVDLTYNRIHPDLIKELKKTRSELGKSGHHLHRWLTTQPNGGHPRLKQHAEGVTALLSVAKTWTQFETWMDKRYPRFNETPRALFPDDFTEDMDGATSST